ncbi:MAG TPA: hypothetical protein VEQ63_11080 [Bryobacteraceae bacterium]|nr:hypothetical protein [Bryobacteraceae bacterium]
MKSLALKLALMALGSVAGCFGQLSIGVQSYAGFSPSAPVSPGSVISIYPAGQNFSNVTLTTAQALPLPRELNNVRVRIAGADAPLYFVAPGQINAIVPLATPTTGRQTVEVVQGGNVIASGSVLVFDWAPVLASLSATPDRPGIVQNFSQNPQAPPTNSQANPARRGDVLTIYASGCGPVNPAVPDGAPASGVSSVTGTVRVYFAAAEVTPTFAGANQIPGICQINAAVPDHPSVINGQVPLYFTVNGIESNYVTIWVQ